MKQISIALVLAVAAGCSESSKPPPAPAPASAPAVKKEARPPAKEALSYKTPPEWVSEEATGMRKAQYRVPDKNGKEGPAVLTFFTMTPLTVDKMTEYWGAKMGGGDPVVTKVEGAAVPTTILDFTGPYSDEGGAIENARFLGAIIETPGNSYWYLKFAGPAGTVTGWKDAFTELLKGLRPIE